MPKKYKYGTAIRPMMTHIVETKPNISKTQRILKTEEMGILRRIAENSGTLNKL